MKINALSKTRPFEKGYSRIQCNMRLRMQPRSVTDDKMASTFTKRIWQPYCAEI